MSWLIDTCCISELVKKKPNPKVVKWFDDMDELTMYVSVITFGELRKGIEKLPDSEKKDELNQWVKEDLSNRFKNRILDVSMKEVNEWGKVLAKAENNGTPLPAIDALIAATAKVHDLTVVTRNTKDMKNAGAGLTNPWTYEPPDT
jgi:toxin FitB